MSGDTKKQKTTIEVDADKKTLTFIKPGDIKKVAFIEISHLIGVGQSSVFVGFRKGGFWE